MEITVAGVALLILVGLLMRGGCGRVGIIIASMCGSALTFIASARIIAWDIGTQVAGVANDLGSTGVG